MHRLLIVSALALVFALGPATLALAFPVRGCVGILTAADHAAAILDTSMFEACK